MSATLKIEHDEIDDFVTVIVDCKHGTSTAMVAHSPAMRVPDDVVVLVVLANHASNQTCKCTRHLWERYGPGSAASDR
jgi:hypothetical protein